MREGWRSEVRGFRNFESRLSRMSRALRSTVSGTALLYFISNLLGWEKRAPTEDSIGTAETLAGL